MKGVAARRWDIIKLEVPDERGRHVKEHCISLDKVLLFIGSEDLLDA